MNSAATVQRESHETPSERGGFGQTRCRLTSEEIARLASRIADGDLDARNALVQGNLKLVYLVARRYLRRGLTQEDLIGEGNLGLIRAAEGYDPAFGTCFSTYATYWIKEAILSALNNTAATIRLPENISKLMGRWRRMERSLRVMGGLPPRFEEIAKAMGLDDSERALMARAQVVSELELESVLTDRRSSGTLGMLDGCFTPEEALEAEEEQAFLLRRLERLEGRQRAVVMLKFGLAGEAPMSLSEIAARLEITVKVVRNLVAAAIEDLGDTQEAPTASTETSYGSRVG